MRRLACQHDRDTAPLPNSCAGRASTAIMSNTTAKPKLPPDPKVEAPPRRRTFTGECTAKILAECDAAAEPGVIGAILSRKGLYSTHLVDWRRRRADRCAAGLNPTTTERPRSATHIAPPRRSSCSSSARTPKIQERLRRADIIIEAPDSWLRCSSRCVRRPSRAGATNHRREGDHPGGWSAAHLRDLRGAPGDRVPVVKAGRLSGAAQPVRALSGAQRAQVLSLPAASAS